MQKNFTKCSWAQVVIYSHAFYKVVNLAPPVPVSDWAFQGCPFIPDHETPSFVFPVPACLRCCWHQIQIRYRDCTKWLMTVKNRTFVQSLNSLAFARGKRGKAEWAPHALVCFSMVRWLALMMSSLLTMAHARLTLLLWFSPLHRLFQKSALSRTKWISWWRRWSWGAAPHIL